MHEFKKVYLALALATLGMCSNSLADDLSQIKANIDSGKTNATQVLQQYQQTSKALNSKLNAVTALRLEAEQEAKLADSQTTNRGILHLVLLLSVRRSQHLVLS